MVGFTKLDPADEGHNARLTRIEARLALLEAFRDKEAFNSKDREDSLLKWRDEVNGLLEDRNSQYVAIFKLVDKRLASLEHPDRLGSADAALKSQAAQQQAQPPADLYAPLRNDTKAVLDLAAFARRLLDPHDLGWAVSAEVRSLAFEALGLAKK